MTQNRAEVRKVTVTDREDGQRIDNFLLKQIPGVPKSLVYKLLRSGQVRVNGGRVKADIQAKFVSVAGEVHGNLVAGEQIVIRKTATMLGNLTAPRVGLEDGCRFRGSVEMEAPRQNASSTPSASASSTSSSPSSAKPEPAKSESHSNKPEPAPLRT